MKRMISRVTALGTAIALPAATMIMLAAPAAQAVPTGSAVLTYSGDVTRAFTLPANVNRILVTVVGAGGGGYGGGTGGSGAAVTSTLAVPAGATLGLRVGGGGGQERSDAPGFFGTAPGGSATSLQVNGVYVAVAGGGGGSTNGAGGSGAAANTADGGAGAGQYGGGGGTSAAGGAGGGPNGPVAGGTVGFVGGGNAAAGSAGGGGGFWNGGNGGSGMSGGSPHTDFGVSAAFKRPVFSQAGGGGAGFGGGGALGGGGGYSGGGGSSNAAGAGGSWVNGAYVSGAPTYRPAPYSVEGGTYGLGGTAARPGGDGVIYVRWGSLPGKVTKLKVAGSSSAGKRKVTWKKPTGTVTGYKIVVTQKGKKKYNGVHLISKTVSPRSTVLKKKELFAKAKKLNKFKGSRANFVVHVKALNVMGEGPVAKKKFQAVK